MDHGQKTHVEQRFSLKGKGPVFAVAPMIDWIYE